MDQWGRVPPAVDDVLYQVFSAEWDTTPMLYAEAFGDTIELRMEAPSEEEALAYLQLCFHAAADAAGEPLPPAWHYDVRAVRLQRASAAYPESRSNTRTAGRENPNQSITDKQRMGLNVIDHHQQPARDAGLLPRRHEMARVPAAGGVGTVSPNSWPPPRSAPPASGRATHACCRRSSMR